MNEELSSTNENLTSDDSLTPLVLPLSQTQLWVRICSIMGFISGGFMILAALGMMAFSGALPEADAGLPSGAMTGVGIVYILLSAVYFVPSYFLHQYANAINSVKENNNIENLTAALIHQKSFWKFAGIVMLVMISLAILGIVVAIGLPMMLS